MRLDQHRADRLAALGVDVGADGHDVLEHVAQVAGDGDLVDRVDDAPALDPEAGGAARVVAGDVVDALPHQLGDEQAAAELAQHRRQVVAGLREAAGQAQVLRAAGMPGGLHAQLARRIARQEVALHHPALDDGRAPACERPRRRRARCPCPWPGAGPRRCRCDRPAPAGPGCRPGSWSCGTARRPQVACTKAPSRPAATVDSNSTGTSAGGRRLRDFSRASARSAA